MKTIFVFIFILFVALIQQTLATYQPNTEDIKKTIELKNQLSELTKDNNQDLWNYYYQIKNLYNTYKSDERLNYMLSELKSLLRNNLQVKKQEAKILSKQNKINFLNINSWNVFWDQAISENCIWWYNTLDDIAFSYDFSTALLVATRYVESSCGYYLPQNTWWPFQIISKNYWTWEISEEIFVQSVIDFIEFSKNKYNWYEERNKEDNLKINVDYKNLELSWIIRHWALYNWLSWYTVYGDILPLNPNYVFNNFGENFSGAKKNWLMAEFINILEREIINKY